MYKSYLEPLRNRLKSHCEESDDEAIQKPWIAARPLDRLGVARNDG